MKSDYDKWFVSTDGTMTAIKCKREKFIDFLRDLFGPVKASNLVSQFRRATFAEHCHYELELKED